ncbi:MAG: START-like domain-containing protein [Bacteroidota bacterium]
MKNKIELEFGLNSSPKVLYNMLSTPGGLSEWFADDVNLKGNVFTFIWDGSEEQAEVIGKKENKYIRFKWIDEDDEKAFFEFRINVDELTGDVALVITDFAEEDEKEEAMELWESQVSGLKHTLGLI